ncbi:hypothetical protein RhiJN_20669 [Ceratobasidium sp. AG-Ba]|nr:hypothetical protein RhiJN_20669 [Ceratobasidium sp. AG-Ba]
MSYWNLAAISHKYRSLPGENHPIERLSRLATLLNSLLVRRMVGFYSTEGKDPPYTIDGYGQDDYDTQWTLVASAIELNAAGVPYRVESGSEASSARSSSIRPRALTNSCPDNHRASKRHANDSRQDGAGYPPTSVASEPIATYHSSRASNSRTHLGHEDLGRLRLPPMHSRSGPVNSPATSNQSLPPLRYALPPFDFDHRGPAQAQPEPRSVHQNPRLAATLTTVYASPDFEPSTLRSPAVSDSTAFPCFSTQALSLPRRTANRTPSFEPSPATNSPLLADHGAITGANLSFNRRPTSSNSSAPVGGFTHNSVNAPLPRNLDIGVATAWDGGPDWATGLLDYDPSEFASHHSTPIVTSSPSRPSKAVHGLSASTPWPGGDSSATRPSQSGSTSWPFTQTTYAHDQRSVPIPQSHEDVIDLTSSSPPDVATVFESVRVKRSSTPLIKQESFDFFLPEQLEPQPECKPEPQPGPRPKTPPCTPQLEERAAVGQKRKTSVAQPLCGYNVQEYPWAIYPGGPVLYLSADAKSQLFSARRSNCRWLLSEDMLIIEALFPLLYSKTAHKYLRRALQAVHKEGSKSYSKPAVEISVDVFDNARIPSAIYNRIQHLCLTWQGVNALLALIGGSIDFTLPTPKLIKQLNDQIDYHQSRETLLKGLHGWTVIMNCKSRDKSKSIQACMAQYLHGHPTYDPVAFRSGRLAPATSAAVNFWINLADSDSDSELDLGAPAQLVAEPAAPSIAPTLPHAPNTASTKPTSNKGKGRAVPQAKQKPADNSAVEGSVSSLPSAPSSISERASTSSTPVTTPHSVSSGFVVPRQPVPPRTGSRPTASGRSTTSLDTHSPKDVSQALKLELIREARSAGDKGTSESAWLIKREQEMLSVARSREHELKARQISIQETQANAEIDMKQKNQLVQMCLQIQNSSCPDPTSLTRISSILNATLDATAAAAKLKIPLPGPGPSPETPAFGSAPGLVLQSRAGQPVPASPRRSRRSPSVLPQRQPSQTPGAGPSSCAGVSVVSPNRANLESEFDWASEDVDTSHNNQQPWDF